HERKHESSHLGLIRKYLLQKYDLERNEVDVKTIMSKHQEVLFSWQKSKRKECMESYSPMTTTSSTDPIHRRGCPKGIIRLSKRECCASYRIVTCTLEVHR